MTEAVLNLNTFTTKLIPFPSWDKSLFTAPNFYEADTETNEAKFVSHAADAIKSKEKINDIILKAFLNEDYCKIAHFILGINTGFRDSDLRNIKVKDIFNPDGTVRDFYACNEKKTGKPRISYLNDTVKKALMFLVAVKKNARRTIFSRRTNGLI